MNENLAEEEKVEEEEEEKAKGFVLEAEEMLKIVSDKNLTKDKAIKFSSLIDKYQEQPTLLDPLLEKLIQPLMSNLFGISDVLPKWNETAESACIAVYSISKVRGHRIVTRFFPHAVKDLALALSYPLPEPSKWESRYVLLLWLSTLVLVPFALHSVDDGTKSQNSIENRLLELGKECLADSARASEAAALLIARLVTRPDIHSMLLAPFCSWCCQKLVETGNNGPFSLAILATLAHIFKSGQREELLGIADDVLRALQSLQESKIGTLGRKFRIKVLQRIGTTFLKPRIPSWRYCVGRRTLLSTTSTNSTSSKTEEIQSQQENDESLIEVPEQCESVFDSLLSGLKDKDTVTRWSSAKGIGRLTGRLPLKMADEIVGAVLGLFNITEADSAWHGGCLALAELARRGLLLPERLNQVIPLVEKALVFDEIRGSHSVGSHVRDAACYVCWAFARAYSASVMQQHVLKMAGTLLITALFDREVNCRRAAAAAFQENVGRQQGNFPHGIEIVTTADYFTLSNRQNAFLHISPQIAKYEEYRDILLEHLVQVKVQHWDKAIRELTAETLEVLAPLCVDSVLNRHIPYLIPCTLSSDPSLRHGSILAIARFLNGLRKCNNHKLPEQLCESIADIIPIMEDSRLFRGRGVELIRSAICSLIQSISLSKIPLRKKKASETEPQTNSTTSTQSKLEKRFNAPIGYKAVNRPRIAVMQDVLDECFQQPFESVQQAASLAFRSFARQYYVSETNEMEITAVQTIEKCISKYCKQVLTDRNPAVRRGFALAIGQLPLAAIIPHKELIFKSLISATIIPSDPEMRDAEARRNAVIALASIAKTLGNNMLPSDLDEIIGCFAKSLADWSVDSRGDVGSWVREAALKGLQEVCIAIPQELITRERATIIIREICGQLGQKIDKLRAISGTVLKSVLPHCINCIHFDEITQIVSTFPEGWQSESQLTFEMACEFIAFQEFRESSLCGIAPTIGGLTKSLSISALSSLKKLLLRYDTSFLSSFAQYYLKTMEKNSNNSRLSIPLIVTITLLIQEGQFSRLQTELSSFTSSLCNLALKQISHTKDLSKINSSIQLFCETLRLSPIKTQLNEISTASLLPMIGLLQHPYPKIRKITAEYLFSILSSEIGIETLLDFLSSTQWEDESILLPPNSANIIADLCKYFNFNQEMLPKFTVPQETSSRHSTTEIGYSELVKETSHM